MPGTSAGTAPGATGTPACSADPRQARSADGARTVSARRDCRGMDFSAPIGTARKWATLAISCLAVLVLSIDLTALHLAIPNLIDDLSPSGTQILWIADVYGFALAGLLVTMGGIGDRIGRKKLL